MKVVGVTPRDKSVGNLIFWFDKHFRTLQFTTIRNKLTGGQTNL